MVLSLCLSTVLLSMGQATCKLRREMFSLLHLKAESLWVAENWDALFTSVEKALIHNGDSGAEKQMCP